MNLQCIVCEKKADVIYDAQTMCREHFELMFKDQYGTKNVSDKKNWGKSVYEMKGYPK